MKGHTNNPNGRPLGKVNRTTDQLRNVFVSFLEDNIVVLQESFDELDARNKLMFMEKIARLVLPPPLNELQRLTDEQLNELIYKLKNQNDAKFGTY